jgi:hypothetical protein
MTIMSDAARILGTRAAAGDVDRYGWYAAEMVTELLVNCASEVV